MRPPYHTAKHTADQFSGVPLFPGFHRFRNPLYTPRLKFLWGCAFQLERVEWQIHCNRNTRQCFESIGTRTSGADQRDSGGALRAPVGSGRRVHADVDGTVLVFECADTHVGEEAGGVEAVVSHERLVRARLLLVLVQDALRV